MSAFDYNRDFCDGRHTQSVSSFTSQSGVQSEILHTTNFQILGDNPDRAYGDIHAREYLVEELSKRERTLHLAEELSKRHYLPGEGTRDRA